MSDCVFCKIIGGEIPSKKAYEDEDILAFYDIEPQAPVHVLVVPKKHIASLAELCVDDEGIVGRIMGVAARVAKENGLNDNGYRVVTNVGRHGAQSVLHLHFHVIGGRQLEPSIG